MPVTIPLVAASRTVEMAQSGAAVGSVATDLATQIGKQRATLDGLRESWQGTASEAATAKAAPTLVRMQRMHAVMTRVQSVLLEGGGQLVSTRTDLLRIVGQLAQLGWQVAPDGTVSARPGSPLDRYAQLSPVNAMRIQQLAAANSTTVKTLLAVFDTTDRQIDQNLRNALTGLDGQALQFGSGGIPLPEAPPDSGPQIPEGKDPVGVKRWWDSLSQGQRDQLLRDHPDMLGNLNGIPVPDRSTANKTVLQHDLDRVISAAADHHVTVDDAAAHPQRYGLTPTDVTRYNNATKVRDGLAANSANTNGTPTFLQVYEPERFNGQGRAAIAIGNPDTADNTTVAVPGTSHSVTEGWLSSDVRGKCLQRGEAR